MDSHFYFPAQFDIDSFLNDPHLCPAPTQPLLTFPTPSELMVDLADTTHFLDPTPEPSIDSSRKLKKRPTITAVSTTHGSTFVPTDPDSISSHEKKRHYLECIEQYIQYLHEQFELLGERPPVMEKVASYRGLSSRSIRTLLVHMEHNTRKLTERTHDEEERFLSLAQELS